MAGVNFPPRVALAHLPTPVEKLERFGRRLGEQTVYVKRDDFTGAELSGNKIRKLEFYLAEAVASGATAVITHAGIQSNHCRATAVAARKLGLTPILILAGEKPVNWDGNYFLDRIVGAKIFFADREDFFNPDQVIRKVEEWAVRRGLKPYLIPIGASGSLGLWGYIDCVREIADQGREMGINFDMIVCAVGSGGTLAGLLAGREIFGISAGIYGFNVLETADFLKERIAVQLKEFEERFSYRFNLSKAGIPVIDGYVGAGYGATWPELTGFIREMAETEGIILDPVYTGKAMLGLVDQIKAGRFREAKNILFIHTGGIFGIFPKREAFFSQTEDTF